MKNSFTNKSIVKKHMLTLLMLGLIPALTVSWFSESIAERELKKQFYTNVESVRLSKSKSIQRYFIGIQEQLLNTAEASHTIDAMNAFTKSYRSLLIESGINKTEELNQIKQGISTFYSKDFLTEFNKYNRRAIEINPLVESLSPSALVAQYAYVKSNESSIGSKYLLNGVEEDTSYHHYHKRYHRDFRNTLKRFNYSDIFLVEPKGGNIVYSTAKKLDYATSLVTGPYSKTHLASAFREALTLRAGEFSFKDFESYLPSYNKLSSFIASPIYDKNVIVGVLIFQMPIEALNTIMHEQDSVAHIADSYLIAKNNLVRSSSFLGAKNYAVEATFNDIEPRVMQNDAVTRAFNGETATDIIVDENGNSILSSFTKVTIRGGIEWAVVSQVSTSEAFGGITLLRSTLLTISIVAIIFIVGFALFLTRLLTTPILKLTKAVKLVEGNGDYNHKIDNQQGDEIGEASRAFNRLLNNLSKVMGDTSNVFNRVTKGDFEGSIDSEYPGQLGVLSTAVNHAIASIKTAKEEQESHALIAKENEERATAAADQAQAQARELTVIKKALDSSNSSTMIADDDYNLIYTNSSLDELMNEAERDIRVALPNFTADELVGKNIDIFHIDPSHQRAVLDRLKTTYVSDLKIGQRVMQITATPIIEDGIRIGTVVVWTDRTLELSIEKDVNNLIKAAAYGDFSNRLNLDGKDGFFLSISQGLNLLLETSNIAIDDIKRVFSALAGGDLSQRIDRDYQGGFAQLKADANNTIDKLKEVIGDIDSSLALLHKVPRRSLLEMES